MAPVKLSAETLKAGDPITATVTVTNAGTLDGDEVVEAYLKTPQTDGPIESLGRISASFDSGRAERAKSTITD